MLTCTHIQTEHRQLYLQLFFFFFLVAANVIWDQFEHFLPINFSYSDFAHSNDVVIILTTAWGLLGSGSIQHSNKGVPAVTNATLNPNMQGITLCKEKKKRHITKYCGRKKPFLAILHSWSLKCIPTTLKHHCILISVWVGLPFQCGKSAVACSWVIKLIYFTLATLSCFTLLTVVAQATTEH